MPPRLPRAAIPPEDARVLFAPLRNPKRYEYDPEAGYAQRPNLDIVRYLAEHPRRKWHMVTNEHALRSRRRVPQHPPDRVVLVTGDSHTIGVVPQEETLTDRLEVLLEERGEDVDVWNAGCGGYSFFEYDGCLEKHRDLAPDDFVIVAYGGNDFTGLLPRLRYVLRCRFASPGENWSDTLRAGKELAPAGLAQEFHQLGWFERVPEDVDFALAGALAVLRGTAERCRERGIRLWVAYLPPAIDVDPDFDADVNRRLAELFGLDHEDLRRTDRLADRFLEALAQEGIETIDLRPFLRASPEGTYWHTDHHIATRGHEIVARALAMRLALR